MELVMQEACGAASVQKRETGQMHCQSVESRQCKIRKSSNCNDVPWSLRVHHSREKEFPAVEL